jgi:hypothetical protein
LLNIQFCQSLGILQVLSGLGEQLVLLDLVWQAIEEFLRCWKSSDTHRLRCAGSCKDDNHDGSLLIRIV